MYKFRNDLSPPLIDDMFQVRKNNFNLRYFQKIESDKKSSVKIDLETIFCRVPQLWNLAPAEIKQFPFLSTSKRK